MTTTNNPYYTYLAKIPSIAIVAPKPTKKQTPHFRFTCITAPKYEALISKCYLGDSPLYYDNVMATAPRKLLPPTAWKPETIQYIYSHLKDPTVQYIVFPALLDEIITKKCPAPQSKKPQPPSHPVFFAYHKTTSTLELWDFNYAKTQSALHYDSTVSIMTTFMKALLGTFGMELSSASIAIPTIPEDRYARLKELVQKAHYHHLYQSFLVNFIATRVRYFKKDASEETNIKRTTLVISRRVIPLKRQTSIHKYLDVYTQFKTHLALHQESIQTPRYYNPRFPPPPMCEEGAYYDFYREICEPLHAPVVVPKGTYQKNKPLLYKNNILHYYTYIALYFLQKYTNLAMIVPKYKVQPHTYYYALRWHYNPKLTGRTRFTLKTPPSYERFLKKAMKDPRVRFIPFILALKGTDASMHANLILIDKTNQTVERFEPNMGGYVSKEDDRTINETALDKQITELFAPYQLRFVPTSETCPIGMHHIEWFEKTDNVFDVGGNCALWTIYLLELRIANPDVPPATVTNYAIQEISKTGSFKHFANQYADYLIRVSKEARSKQMGLVPPANPVTPANNNTATAPTAIPDLKIIMS